MIRPSPPDSTLSARSASQPVCQSSLQYRHYITYTHTNMRAQSEHTSLPLPHPHHIYAGRRRQDRQDMIQHASASRQVHGTNFLSPRGSRLEQSCRINERHRRAKSPYLLPITTQQQAAALPRFPVSTRPACEAPGDRPCVQSVQGIRHKPPSMIPTA